MVKAKTTRKIGFATMIVLGLVWWAMSGGRSEGQLGQTGSAPKEPPLAKTQGRYQVAVGGHSPYIVLIDTATGQCWGRDVAGEGKWADLDSPAPALMNPPKQVEPRL